MCEDYNVRVVIGDENIHYDPEESVDISHYIDDTLSIGRIEICLEGQWMAICGNIWTQEDASVACRQLGFSGPGKFSIELSVLVSIAILHFCGYL